MRTVELLQIRLICAGNKYSGSMNLSDVKQALDIGPTVDMHVLAGFLIGKLGPTNAVDFDVYLNFDSVDLSQVMKNLKAAYVKATTPVVRTPLTVANFKKWLRGYVKAHPTYEDNVWNEKTKAYRTVQRKNTVKKLLIDVIIARDRMSLSDYKSYELVGAMLDFHRNGTKGYNSMSMAELFAKVNDELFDPDNSPFEFDDLEDFLEEFEARVDEEEEG